MMLAALTTPQITGGSRPRDRRNYCARTLGRECGGYNTREGKKPASTCETLLAPGARAARGRWPNKPITGNRNEQLPLSRQAFRTARRRAAADAIEDRKRAADGATGRKAPARRESPADLRVARAAPGYLTRR